MVVSIRVEGLRALSVRIGKLQKKAQGSLLRKSVAAGARRFRDEARQRVAVESGNLRRHIVVKKLRDRKPGRVQYAVGIATGSGTYSNIRHNRRKRRVGQSYETSGDAYYGWMLEFGYIQKYPRIFKNGRWFTIMRRRKKGGKYEKVPLKVPKVMPAKPFLRPSYETKKQAALDTVFTQLKKGLLTHD